MHFRLFTQTIITYCWWMLLSDTIKSSPRTDSNHTNWVLRLWQWVCFCRELMPSILAFWRPLSAIGFAVL